MRYLIAFLAIAIVAPSAFGFVIYDTQIQNDLAYTNATLGLSATNPVNFWNIEFILPDNSNVISVRDTRGPIAEYSVHGKSIQIKTNNGPQRTTEVITIELVTNGAIDNSYFPLKTVKLSYAGFESENTAVNIKTNERIITSNIPFGFAIDKKSNSLSFSGEGPLGVIFTMSNSGTELDNYVVMGSGDISDAQKLNQIVPRIIGIIPYYNKFPVVILPDNSYTDQLDGFSAGTYKTGGIILIPEGKVGKKESVGIILHETVHGYNDQILRWSGAKVGWFDEGTATYAAWVANQLTGVKQPEIFGEPIEYVEGFIKYTIPSEGNREDLWKYYQEGRDDMKSWTSHAAQDDATRHFGYAFSQLMIRNYVNENSPAALHSLYAEINKVNHRVDSIEEYNAIVLAAMKTDMKPCYSTNREIFDRCLDEINNMKAEVPSANVVTETYGSQIDTQKLLNETLSKVEEENERFTFSKVLFKISERIERFISWLNGLFR